MTGAEKLEVIEAMKELIDLKMSLSTKGVPTVRAIEDIVGFDITAAERNDLMAEMPVVPAKVSWETPKSIAWAARKARKLKIQSKRGK